MRFATATVIQLQLFSAYLRAAKGKGFTEIRSSFFDDEDVSKRCALGCLLPVKNPFDALDEFRCIGPYLRRFLGFLDSDNRTNYTSFTWEVMKTFDNPVGFDFAKGGSVQGQDVPEDAEYHTFESMADLVDEEIKMRGTNV